MDHRQLSLFTEQASIQDVRNPEQLYQLLFANLDFHGQDSAYASHNFHSFPAKYPPQLPNKFIQALTQLAETVLDPMMGSGTTLVEAFLSNRQAVGFDIDPLAIKLAQVKTTPLDRHHLLQLGNKIISKAMDTVQNQATKLESELQQRFGRKTCEFINYWFAQETQIDLFALIKEIEQIENEEIRTFFEIVFSAIIITKSGGVSLAFDLAHTRPHRAKIVYNTKGELILGQDLIGDPSPRLQLLTKKLRSPFDEFGKRLRKNLDSLPASDADRLAPVIKYGDSQQLPLDDDSVDLIVTSPPYASNAIDYMRAHKFSLVWFGYPVEELGQKRRTYIGGEAITNVEFERLPVYPTQIIDEIIVLDAKKGLVLHRYYSEMVRVLREMYRVLKPSKMAVVVVGNSIIRGRDSETGQCLTEIGRTIGFNVPAIGVRNIDRNRRMMPAGSKVDQDSQIQQRMHQEYVIGFIKPSI